MTSLSISLLMKEIEEPLFGAMHDARWKRSVIRLVEEPSNAKEKYKARLLADAEDLTIACECCRFLGGTMDDLDKNKIPVAAFCRIKEDSERVATHHQNWLGTIHGLVATGDLEGIKHNTATYDGMWAGKWKEWDAN